MLPDFTPAAVPHNAVRHNNIAIKYNLLILPLVLVNIKRQR